MKNKILQRHPQELQTKKPSKHNTTPPHLKTNNEARTRRRIFQNGRKALKDSRGRPHATNEEGEQKSQFWWGYGGRRIATERKRARATERGPQSRKEKGKKKKKKGSRRKEKERGGERMELGVAVPCHAMQEERRREDLRI